MANTQLKNKGKIFNLAAISMLAAIIVVLQVTGLGFIMSPPISMTTLHIPVIVGGIILGPVSGGILGGVMGTLAIINSTIRGVSPADLAFSPFHSGHPVGSIVMSLGVRILIGVVAGLVFRALKKATVNDSISVILSAFLATLTNTIGVMTCLWLIFTDLSVTFKIVIETIFAVNFLLEATAAILFAIAFAKALPALRKYMRK